MLTIQETIYTRFTIALCKLKGIEQVNDNIYTEMTAKYLNKTVSSQVQFILKLSEEEFLVNTAIITGLMEASESWSEFEKLYEKQKEEAKDNTPTDQPLDLTEFNKVLKQLLNTPPPKKKKK